MAVAFVGFRVGTEGGQLPRLALFFYVSTNQREAAFLRPVEAAELAGLSTRAIYRAIERGELRAARLCSRLRIPRAAFDEWVERVRCARCRAPGRDVPACTSAGRGQLPVASRSSRGGVVMSIERVERKDGGVVWRVRWRQAGQNRSKVLGRKRDAEAFDAELRRRKRTGEIAQLDAGKETLAEFGEEWWRLYAEPNLAPTTLKVYAILWDTHVLPRLGSLRLRELTPSIIKRFRLELEAEGVGRVSIRKAMTLLQGVLQRACEWDRLAINPARAVRKPSSARARAVTPLPPDTVEAMRDWLLGASSFATRRSCPSSRTPGCGRARRLR